MKIEFKVLVLLLFFYSLGSAQNNFTQGIISEVLAENQNKVIQLAEAFPENKYDWSPGEGVFSVREILLHIASSNYYLMAKMGFAPPPELDLMRLSAITGKNNVVSVIKASNTFVLKNIPAIRDEQLKIEVDFGFMKATTLGGLLRVMEHNGEHKGQLIAYARSNAITPPWSEK